MEDFTIDLIKNKDLITKLPTKLNDKLENTDNQDISIETSEEIKTLPSGLIISSGFVFAASPLYPPLLLLGIIEFSLGLYLYGRE